MTTLRPIRLPDDLDAVWRVAIAAEDGVIEDTNVTREEIRSQLEAPDVAHDDGVRVAVDDGGQIVGFVSVGLDPESCEIQVDAYALPGTGDDILDLLLGHGTAFAHRYAAALDDPSGWRVGAGAIAGDVAYGAALTRAGLAPVRRFHRMKADLTSLPELAIPSSPGVVIETVGDDEAQQRLVHDVLEEAFQEHWNYAYHPWDDWIGYIRNRAFDPSQWWLVRVDGEPAAALVGNDLMAESGGAYVSMLGVRKQFRRRGIARALLLTAFADARRRGRDSVRLGVDTDNDTGAPALYSDLGMTPVEVIDAYALPLA